MKISEIRILRGVHVEASAKEVANHLKDIDIIFIECIKSASWVKPLLMSLHGLSRDPSYAEKFGENLAENLKYRFPFQIAWELRGTGKYWFLVDQVIEDDKFEEEFKKYMPGYDLDVFLKALLKSPDKRYHYFNSYTTHTARIVHARDKLVVSQVSKLIENSSTTIEPYFEGKDSYKIAIIQGYMHHTKGLLRKVFPETRITDSIFNQELVNNVTSISPLVEFTSIKLRNPTKPIPNKKIDQAFLALLESNDSNSNKLQASKYAGLTPGERISAVTAEDFTSENDRKLVENFEKIKSYDEKELQARIEAQLAKRKGS